MHVFGPTFTPLNLLEHNREFMSRPDATLIAMTWFAMARRAFG
jgi:hypothetical protein